MDYSNKKALLIDIRSCGNSNKGDLSGVRFCLSPYEFLNKSDIQLKIFCLLLLLSQNISTNWRITCYCFGGYMSLLWTSFMAQTKENFKLLSNLSHARHYRFKKGY